MKHHQSGTLNWVQPIHQDIGVPDNIFICQEGLFISVRRELLFFRTSDRGRVCCAVSLPWVAWSRKHRRIFGF